MKHSLSHGSGVLIIDHSNSPGVTAADVAHVPHGAVMVPGGSVLEADVQVCSHCQRAVLLNPDRTRPREYCPKCDHYICDSPGCNVGCSPFKRVLDRAQELAEKFINEPENPDATIDVDALREPVPSVSMSSGIVITDA